MIKKRTRLSPEDRREQILDSTQRYILKNGLNSLTMDSLAKLANVSKPLLYKYYDTRLELLQALLLREEARFVKKLRLALANAVNFEQVVYTTVNLDFDQEVRGDVVQILQDQPDIFAALESVRKNRVGSLEKFLVDAVMDISSLPKEDARRVFLMGSAASKSAAEHYSLYGGNRSSAVDLTVEFITKAIGPRPS
jgi:AcrR family transcriptional regulator|tara:strand:+ start:296 stop:880 length:585 start_codon:yes stop_codon:yes gene_type:complete